MKSQHNRLPADAPRGFSGAAIDRSKPLSFRLDGRLVSGFAGDTVLSAAIASGIDTLGLHSEYPVGLTSCAAPAIIAASHAGALQHALPMARTPATDNADYQVLGGKRANMLARLFLPGRSLGLPLNQPHVLDEPWRAHAGTPAQQSDLVVIGGGVAGMSAALAGVRAGLSVTLVEASPLLGGHSGLFGTQEGEDSPEASMARLRDSVTGSDAITVITCAQAYAMRPGLVRVHAVKQADSSVTGEVLDLPARFIVIATGSRERLPIFAGNRLPRVGGTLDAYELAVRYGVWPGQNALVATASNFAYRLAMLASDAGVTVNRILDSRPGPASRFIEFSRAYGMVQASGTKIAGVSAARAGGSLAVTVDRADAAPLTTERLLVCGGWQPDLTLWHIAGGTSRWNTARHRLEAEGELYGIALAGSAAGYLTRRGCIQSGGDAMHYLLGKSRKPVDDPLIDPLYESPDDPTPVGSLSDGAPAYLDSGAEFLRRPQPAPRRWTNLFRRNVMTGLTALSEAPQPLAINDVAAGVNLGLIPPGAAGVVAQERVALVALAASEGDTMHHSDTAPAPAEVPHYLMGRFGRNAHVVRLIPSEERRFEPGMLIHLSADDTDPLTAIGVVLRHHGDTATALLASTAAKAGQAVSVRDHGRAIAAKVELGGLGECA